MNHFLEISTLFPKTIISARKELDLKISSEAYLGIFNKNIQNAKLVFEKYYSQLDNQINEDN